MINNEFDCLKPYSMHAIRLGELIERIKNIEHHTNTLLLSSLYNILYDTHNIQHTTHNTQHITTDSGEQLY